MSDQEKEKAPDSPVPMSAVPPFAQIVTTAANAFGRGEDDYDHTELLFGLDHSGRVWQWVLADPERVGSADGWRLLPNTTYQEGAEPPPQRKTR